MTKGRFNEVLKEYGVATLTTVIPEKITEEQLRELLETLTEVVNADEIGMTKKPISKKDMEVYSEVRRLTKLQGAGISKEVLDD